MAGCASECTAIYHPGASLLPGIGPQSPPLAGLGHLEGARGPPQLTQGFEELVEVLAAAHLPGAGEVGHGGGGGGGGGCGGCCGGGGKAGALRAARPRLRSVPSARPKSPGERPSPRALQPRPRPRLRGPCPAGAQPPSPRAPSAPSASESPGCRPGTRSPPAGGGILLPPHHTTTLLKVGAGRGLEETRLASRG